MPPALGKEYVHHTGKRISVIVYRTDEFLKRFCCPIDDSLRLILGEGEYRGGDGDADRERDDDQDRLRGARRGFAAV